MSWKEAACRSIEASVAVVEYALVKQAEILAPGFPSVEELERAIRIKKAMTLNEYPMEMWSEDQRAVISLAVAFELDTVDADRTDFRVLWRGLGCPRGEFFRCDGKIVLVEDMGEAVEKYGAPLSRQYVIEGEGLLGSAGKFLVDDDNKARELVKKWRHAAGMIQVVEAEIGVV